MQLRLQNPFTTNIMRKIFYFLCLGISLFQLSSCKKDPIETPPIAPVVFAEPNTPDGMVKIGTSYINGANAKAYIYSYNSLFVGYNQLFIALYDSTTGKRINNGSLNCLALKHTGSIEKACPKEVQKNTIDSNSLYPINFIFDEASTDSTSWDLNFNFYQTPNNSYSGKLAITVNSTNEPRVLHFKSIVDSQAYVIAYIPPVKVKVGLNDAEFIIHQENSNYSFTAAENLTTVIVLSMPAMGHGSPNNVSPVHTQNGHYMGKTNFTMSGLWKIQLKIYKNGILLSDQVIFDYTI